MKASFSPVIALLLTTSGVVAAAGGVILGTPGPITKEHLVAFWALYNLSTGALLPAPEKVPAMFQHSPLPTMPSGGLVDFAYESIASTCLGIALMIYLSNFQQTGAVQTVAYGSMACFYVFYKAFLKGTISNLGMPKGFGSLNIAVFLGFYYAVFGGGGGDVELIAQIFCSMVTLMGVAGSIAPGLVAKTVFSAKNLGTGKYYYYEREHITDDGNDSPNMLELLLATTIILGSAKCGLIWMFRVFAMWGFIAYSLLFGQDPMTTVGRLGFIYAAMALDSWFLTKDAKEAGSPKSLAYILSGISTAVGAGILMG